MSAPDHKTGYFIILSVIMFLILHGCTGRKVTPPEDLLIGEWYVVKGDIESYSLLNDGDTYIFTGTEAERPVIYGSWKITGDTLFIMMDNGRTSQYKYMLDNDTLYLNGVDEIYTRTIPFETKNPETVILKDISSGFNNLHFSKPEPCEVKCYLNEADNNPARLVRVEGFSISARALSGSAQKHITRISEFLSESGYESGSTEACDTCNCFIGEYQLVTINTIPSEKIPDDTVIIKISAGFLKDR